MGMQHLDAGRTTTRLARTDEEIREARDQDARIVIAGHALRQPNPVADVRLLLSALGLDGKTSAPPSPVRLIRPDEVKGPGKRPKDADTYDEPEGPPPHRRARRTAATVDVHGTRSAYTNGCNCDVCRKAVNTYNQGYAERRRDEAAAGGRPWPPSRAQRKRAKDQADRAAYLAAFQAEALGGAQ